MQNELNKLVEMLFQSINKDEATQAISAEKANAVFDRLSTAAQAKDTEFFQQLVETEKRQGRKKNEPTLLIAATMQERADIVQALIQAGADVNAKVEEFFTFDALEFAVDKGYTKITKILLDGGADPNWNNENPGLCSITKAVRKGNLEIVKMLIDAGAAVKFGTGFRLLVDAAEKSTPEIVQLLLDAGCNVNTRETGQDTPLTAACKRANVEIVRTLIAAGANVNKIGMHEFSPLVAVFYAPKFNQMLSGQGLAEADNNISKKLLTIIQILIDAGADFNPRDLQGRTPLMLAINQGFIEAAKVLIAAGADINILSKPDDKVIIFFRGDGISRTALHFAVETGQEEAVKLLLAAGADLNIPDSQGKTPIDIAERKELMNISELLHR
ncbi:ankyrin repeat domain-containing protein [Dendronalium sp. ChiSLP03b]|uniref:ankyrin repeat domain-containing protein n=1 Tax=Dendronalium sp. ChiSLP03b TaxID=3075381 RepID=UPI002AD43107|nr:ankyrin repeat domain-containing protein [Dendronalium sp. ChiSLP03b]MDZ8208441.1 ankyrin repeat domain-containing protein [Dendronalium sp. ChiSLP03b]